MSTSDKVTGRLPNHALQEERLLRGWTQQEVANRVSTTVVNVSRWERGVTSPNPYFRQQLCLLFEKDAEALGLLPARQSAQSETFFTTEDVPSSLANLAGKKPVDYPASVLALQERFLHHRSMLLTVFVVALVVLVAGGSLLIYAFIFQSRQAQHINQNDSQSIANHITTSPASLLYTFEDGGTDGWVKTGHVSSMQSSSQVGGYEGTHALQIVLSSKNSSDQPFISVNPTSDQPRSGQTLSAALFVPAKTTTMVEAKLYVQDMGYGWHQSAFSVLVPGKWNVQRFRIPSFPGPVLQVGIQFVIWPSNTPATVYIDAVQWG